MSYFVIHEETLLDALRAAHEGEPPDAVILTLYANADRHEHAEPLPDEPSS